MYFTSSLNFLTKGLSINSSFFKVLRQMRKHGQLVLAGFVLQLCLASPCWADPHEEVLKLLKQDLSEQAFVMVSQYLLDHPQDPQMRFWLGNLWVKKGEKKTAAEVFQRLTQDFPELSEPYNNLGILQFESGDFSAAKASFESALKVQPDFALAVENLADTYLLLSRSTLVHATALDPKSKSAKYKLELINQALHDWSQKQNK
jgi:tetratricopeptide (TPR) repeat protein